MRALIVVDVQNDFCEGGSLAVEGGEALASKINAYYLAHASDYKTVVCSMDWHHPSDNDGHFGDPPDFVDSWPQHCVANTPGAALHPSLDVDVWPNFYHGLQIFRKGQGRPAYSAFEGVSAGAQTLRNYLTMRKIDQVDVCGIATDYCVRATALDALQLGFDTRLLLPLTVAVGGEKAMDDVAMELEALGVYIPPL